MRERRLNYYTKTLHDSNTERNMKHYTHSQLISGFLVSLIREQQRFVFLLDVAAAGCEDEQLY